MVDKPMDMDNSTILDDHLCCLMVNWTTIFIDLVSLCHYSHLGQTASQVNRHKTWSTALCRLLGLLDQTASQVYQLRVEDLICFLDFNLRYTSNSSERSTWVDTRRLQTLASLSCLDYFLISFIQFWSSTYLDSRRAEVNGFRLSQGKRATYLLFYLKTRWWTYKTTWPLVIVKALGEGIETPCGVVGFESNVGCQ